MQHEVSNPRAGEVMDRPQVVDAPKKIAPRGQGSGAKAIASKTNRGTAWRMGKLAPRCCAPTGNLGDSKLATSGWSAKAGASHRFQVVGLFVGSGMATPVPC